MESTIGHRTLIHPSHAKILRTTDQKHMLFNSILGDSGANTTTIHYGVYQRLHQNQMIEKVTKTNEGITIENFEGSTSTPCNIEVDLLIQWGDPQENILTRIKAIVVKEMKYDIIFGTNFFQEFRLSCLDPELYRDIVAAGLYAPCYISKRNLEFSHNYIISYHPQLKNKLLIPITEISDEENDYINEKSATWNSQQNQLINENECALLYLPNKPSLYEIYAAVNIVSKMAPNEKYNGKTKHQLTKILKNKSRNRIQISHEIPMIPLPPHQGTLIPFINPHATKPKHMNYLVERDDSILHEWNIPLELMPETILIRNDSQYCYLANSTPNLLHAPVEPQAYYKVKPHTDEDPTEFINDNIIDIHRLNRKLNYNSKAIKQYLRQKGIQPRDWLEFLPLQIASQNPTQKYEINNLNIDNTPTQEKAWITHQETIQNTYIHKESPTEEPSPSKKEEIHICPEDATSDRINQQLQQLIQAMLPEDGSQLDGYTAEIRQRFINEVLPKIIHNTADSQIKGFLRNWQTSQTEQITLQIDPKEEQHYKHKHIPCTVNYHDRTHCQSHLANLLETGIIEHCTDTNYLSPLICVHQKGKRRFCIDLRNNNRLLQQNNAYPLPTADDLLASLSGKKYWACIDLVKAFHQFKLDPESRKFTSFQAPDGTIYQYAGGCFGLHLLPSVFSQFMHHLLKDLSYNCTLNFVDDVIIFADTPHELVNAVSKVCDRMVQANLTINPSKCNLFADEITFIGYKVNKHGVSPDEKKVSAIKNFPKPTTQFHVQSYLGLVNFYRRFIPNYSTMAAPLQELITEPHLRRRESMKKDIQTNWKEEQENAFNYLRHFLASNKVVLNHPDFNSEFILTTDASTFGMGAVLSQIDHNGDERPVQFTSAPVPRNKRHEAPFLLELRAIMMGIDKFYSYLRGCPKFIIKTDSLALTFLEKMSRPSAQFQRWQYELSNLNYVIKHVQGKFNTVADCLSRNPDFIESNPENEEAFQEVCAAITKLRQEKHQLYTELEKLHDIYNNNKSALTKIDYDQRIKLQEELKRKSKSENEYKIRLDALNETFMKSRPFTDLLTSTPPPSKNESSKRVHFELHPNSQAERKSSTDYEICSLHRRDHHKLQKTSEYEVNVTTRSITQSKHTHPKLHLANLDDEIQSLLYQYPYQLHQTCVFRNQNNEYLEGRITSRQHNPLDNKRNQHHFQSLQSTTHNEGLDLKQHDTIFFYWKHDQGWDLYRPLKIKTLWKGTITEDIPPDEKKPFYVTTAAGYGWNESSTEIRKQWITLSQHIYQLEIIHQNSKHYIWIDHETIDHEATKQLRDDLKDSQNTTPTPTHTTPEDQIELEPLPLPPTTPNESTITQLLSLEQYTSHLTATPREQEEAEKLDLQHIYQQQRSAPELETIVAELGDPNLKETLWASTDHCSQHSTSNIKTQSRQVYQSKTAHRPEGEYFWDRIDDQPILKILRYKGKTHRFASYQQIAIEKNGKTQILAPNEPVIVIPRYWGIKLATQKHRQYAHISKRKLFQTLRRSYEWKGMYQDITEATSTCYECNKCITNLQPHGKTKAIIARRPNAVVAIDLLQLPLSRDGYRYVLNIIDYLSRHVVSIPLKRKDQNAVKTAFLKGYLCKFGRPAKIIVDQGKEFSNTLFQDLATFAKIDIRFLPTGRHAGLVERFNKTMQNAFRKYAIENDDRKWSEWLDPYVYRYNLTSHDALDGDSPHYVRFGYHDEDPLVTLTDTKDNQQRPISTQYYKATTIPDIHEYWNHIANFQQATREKDNSRHKGKHKELTFSKGDRAWLYWPNRITREPGDPPAQLKLKDCKCFLVIITDIITPGTWYRVHTDSNVRIEDNIHVENLRPYIPNNQPEGRISKIEDELESCRPQLQKEISHDTIRHVHTESDLIDCHESNPSNTFESNIITKNHPYLQLYICINKRYYKTFYINIHPKIKAQAIWITEVTKQGTAEHELDNSTKIIPLKIFTEKYAPQAKLTLDTLIACNTKSPEKHKSSRNLPPNYEN